MNKVTFSRLIQAVAWGLVLVTSLGLVAPAATAQTNKVVIYFFWGDGCPHCEDAKPVLETMARRNPLVELQSYEVWYVPENQALFKKMAKEAGFEPQSVPTIFVGQRHWMGWSEQIKREVEAQVANCINSGCPDASGEPATPASVIDVPFFGKIDLATQSLALSTALIAFVDGFNPCSMWVLSVLLALTLHTGSRKKVLVIGLVFVTVTSAVYILFIAGLFTMFTFINFMGWVRVVVALIALFFALVNIKDYFWYKEGLSFTISDEKKPGIYAGIRRVLNAGDSLWGMVSATVVLSGGVSLVEFSCTAGFPVLWTNLLAAQKVTSLNFGLLLLLYMVIYQIDELAIFLFAVYTLKANRLEEKHGRILKLIGGTLMLTLAAVMAIDPSLMNSVANSLLVFGIAFSTALVVLVVHRRVLPSFGVYIGSETLPKGPRRRKLRKRG
ncbi:MAG: thioredoxin family protein [Thermoflexales bacterium]|nr:thioredoxin family protein [Thermoflexales bacterium]